MKEVICLRWKDRLISRQFHILLLIDCEPENVYIGIYNIKFDSGWSIFASGKEKAFVTQYNIVL